MRIETLKPHQIITLNDYPVYSMEVLRSYVDRCLSGEQLPLVPVIRKAIVRYHLTPELCRTLASFELRHPSANYFMLDGSHRTTALTLTGREIVVIVYEDDADIREAGDLVATGQVLENGTLEYTLAENCAILNRHFQARPYFMTVRQKTAQLLRENYIALPAQTKSPRSPEGS